MKLKYKKLNPEAKLYPPFYEGDVGYDIISIETKMIGEHYYETLHTGLSIEIPEGYYGLIRTRSSNGINGLQTHPGIIDSGYRGEILVIIYNHNDDIEYIKKGEKIAQLVILPKIIFELEEVNELSKTDRNEKGFGSSGKESKI